MDAITVVYNYAVKASYLDEGEGVSFLKDVQEGFDKDGLPPNRVLNEFIVSLSALSRQPNNADLGQMMGELS